MIALRRAVDAARHALGLSPYKRNRRARFAAFSRPISLGQDANDAIRMRVAAGGAQLVSRIGGTEQAICETRLRRAAGAPVPYPEALRDEARTNSGIHPQDDATLDRFADLYLGCLREVDVLGVLFAHPGEERLADEFCPRAALVEALGLDSFHFTKPWSSQLRGRKVLVVHPFAVSIESQFRRREALFADPDVLPAFELSTVRAVQSLNHPDPRFRTWFEALEWMRGEVSRADFEVAIIGAGAYGLPLAAFVKGMGKTAIHMGGATQLLFGIKGRRWERDAHGTARFFNEHWVRPSRSETPEGELLEGGCYW